jgi:hypothetical protein
VVTTTRVSWLSRTSVITLCVSSWGFSFIFSYQPGLCSSVA